MRKTSSFILLLLLCLLEISAQHTFSGKVINSDKEPIDLAQVVLSGSDSIYAAGYTDEQGEFIFANLPSKDYTLHIIAFGYTTLEVNCSIRSDLKSDFSLFRSEVNLDEVVISADLSEHVKRTATGDIFIFRKKLKIKGMLI